MAKEVKEEIKDKLEPEIEKIEEETVDEDIEKIELEEDKLNAQEKKNFLCPKCGSYYVDGNWVRNPDTSVSILKSGLAYCDKCFKKLFDDDYIGRVEISKDDFEGKKDEIIEIAERTERTLENAYEFEKIISIYEEHDVLYINTNTTNLAKAIGKNIWEDYKGGIEYKWQDKNQYLIVKWFSELQNSSYFKDRLRRKKERFPGSMFFDEED